ncbi:MAG: hypothetical protein BWY72_02394 [Bacteroidetes bacterium ADurb.Bin416]|nr:MAG: hypothetical protein BWY72_02394 [Bacteroidetes bacterium ADurb.Bin416]
MFLGDDAGMILQVGRGGHLARELDNVVRPTGILQISLLAQLLLHSQHIDGLLRQGQRLYGRKDELVGVVVKAGWL